MKTEILRIGCSLPHGTLLELGAPRIAKGGTVEYSHVVLQGLSGARKGMRYGITPVDPAFWAAWLKLNSKLRYVVDGSIFVIK